MYAISSAGRVFRLPGTPGCPRVGRLLKPSLGNNGYWYVSLSRNNRVHTKTLHRLLAITFIPNPEGHPEVRHLDSDRANCSLDNLAWGTTAQNRLDAFAHGTAKAGEDCNFARLTSDQARTIRDEQESVAALAARYRVSAATIYRIRRGTTWRWLDA